MDIEKINQFIQEHASIVSLATFLLGLIIGNYLAIGRDKRKEFNESAKPIRAFLLSEAKEPSPYKKIPTPEEIDMFTNCLPFWKKWLFMGRWNKQAELRVSKQKHDLYGQVSYCNPEVIQKAVKKCLPYTKKA